VMPVSAKKSQRNLVEPPIAHRFAPGAPFSCEAGCGPESSSRQSRWLKCPEASGMKIHVQITAQSEGKTEVIQAVRAWNAGPYARTPWGCPRLQARSILAGLPWIDHKPSFRTSL